MFIKQINYLDNMEKKVLIIDDSKDDLAAMSAILEKENFSVVTANNGAEALDLLKGDGIQLILIDVQMPTLSGYDLLRLLRERLNHKVKMIYVSIIPENEVDMDDIDGFVQKPFDPEGLMSKVNEVL
jgi:CheY-like chemotaxis protein